MKTFCLNSLFSTTRSVAQGESIIEKKQLDDFLGTTKGVLWGGLRAQGYYKNNSNNKPLITVVTAVLNSCSLLEETILNVINQSYSNVEYIVIDGGSTDETVKIIQQYEGAIDYWVSEKDGGMYAALAKGFSEANGAIICYLNAGDFYFPDALESVASIFKETDVSWITGCRCVCDEKSVIYRTEFPLRYKSDLIQRGVYGKYLPYIQQESSFWRKELLSKVDIERLKSLKFAGDYFLWFSFSKFTDVVVVPFKLGVFKKHVGQLSEARDKYWLEVSLFSVKKNIFTFIHIFYELFFWLIATDFKRELIRKLFRCKLKLKFRFNSR